MKSGFSIFYKLTALAINLALIFPLLAIGATAQSMTHSQSALTENQKIIHVLNRLGFGARPGDVEKVKALGLKNYIEQQLNPSSINDAALEAKLQNFDALNISNEELFAKYPNGAAVQTILAQQMGVTRKDIQSTIQKNRAAQQEQTNSADGAAMPKAPADGASDQERQNYQRQLAAIYKQNNLGRPQDITRQLSAARILRGVYSERQLQEQMVDFWTNHFNVYSNKSAVRWYLPEYDRDVIRPNALGNFRDLLLATAQSPAMLFFLDNFQSVAEQKNSNDDNSAQQRQRLERLLNNPQARERFKQAQNLTDAELDARIKKLEQRVTTGQQRQPRGINENYAREIMELHTLGVDSGYTQKDIQEIARAFTGWTITDPRGYRRAAAKMVNGAMNNQQSGAMDKMDNQQSGMINNQQTARRRGAGNNNGRRRNAMGGGNNGRRGAMGDGGDSESGKFYFNERVHDTGVKTVLGQTINEGGIKDGLKVLDILANHPATAKFIARKLAVKFVSDNPSEAFVNRIADAFLKSKGDIKTTLRAMFNDREFYAPENYRVKIKTPFEVTVSALRAVNADTNGLAVQLMLAKMGEPLYGWQAPTGYPDTAEDWVNTGALLERMNFAVAFASNRIPGTKVNLAALAPESAGKQQLLKRFTDLILNGEISDVTRATLLKQLDQPLIEPTIAANETMNADGGAEMMMANTAAADGGNNNGRRGAGRQARLLAPSGNPETFKVVGLILGSPEFQRQ